VCYWYNVAGIAGGNTTGCSPDERIPRQWPQLYNISADPGESMNLAGDLPEVVRAIEARMAEVAAASVEPLQVRRLWPPVAGSPVRTRVCRS
jgi:hypothetical protein